MGFLDPDGCRCMLVPREVPVRRQADPSPPIFSFVLKVRRPYLSRVIHRGDREGRDFSPAPLGGAGRPEGQNLGALVAPCG